MTALIKAGRISALFSYPIKSCAGLSHASIHCDKTGLRDDRRLIVTTCDGLILTQRTEPKLALIKAEIENYGLNGNYANSNCDAGDAPRLTMQAPGLKPLTIELKAGTLKTLDIWGDTSRGYDQGEEAARWLSSYLKKQCRLVQSAGSRQSSYGKGACPNEVTFNDCCPLLIMFEASLADLNSRLLERHKNTVSMDRFRPSIVIADAPAYSEDGLKTLQIGGIEFTTIKPCSRCKIINIDQQTTADTSPEPLRTLSSYRMQQGKPVLGVYATTRAPGWLSLDSATRLKY